ncbi:hypothetical protein MPLA_830050 [Mesorhizobium sp. ORS 3359]|nr:hypothetical protein MPLA_830050 [Mesorhizobium sp. ORS 3359]
MRYRLGRMPEEKERSCFPSLGRKLLAKGPTRSPFQTVKLQRAGVHQSDWMRTAVVNRSDPHI